MRNAFSGWWVALGVDCVQSAPGSLVALVPCFLLGWCIVANTGCAGATSSPALAVGAVPPVARATAVTATGAPPAAELTWDASRSVFQRQILPSESSASLPWDERVRQLLVERSGDVLVTAVGDVIVNRKVSELAEPDHRNLFRILREADIAFANLEMTIHNQLNPKDGLYDFGVAPEFVWEIANLGINLVNLANNHIMDFGNAGLADCLKALDWADIVYAGAGLTLADAHQPGTTRVQGQTMRFGLLGYLRYWDPRHNDRPQSPSLATLDPATITVAQPDGTSREVEGLRSSELATMRDDITLAKRHLQFVIVSIHAHDVSHSRAYGHPHQVPDNDRVMYHQAIEAGADVVFAHGPHVLRGIEIYQGKPIFYSLGNFIYQYRRPERSPVDLVHQRHVEIERPTNVSVDDRRDSLDELESVVVRLTINQERLRRIEIVPVSIDREGPDFGTPRLPTDERGNQILDRVEKLSTPFNTKLVRRGWYDEVVLAN